MKKSTKGLIILTAPFLSGFLLGFLTGGGCRRSDKSEDKQETVTTEVETVSTPEATEEEEAYIPDEISLDEEPGRKEIIYYTKKLSYPKLFDDLNEAHMKVARAVGLPSPPKTRESVDGQTGKLVRLTDNDYYVVDELRYSVPYLTKGAASELEAIAKAFSDSLQSKALLDYKLVVSSVLRTEEDVKKLQRSGNPNASDNSAHCYGTTFDITYTRYWREDENEAFMQPYELTKVLAEVLRDRKEAGKCLVKYERKEHCFHITSTH